MMVATKLVVDVTNSETLTSEFVFTVYGQYSYLSLCQICTKFLPKMLSEFPINCAL